MSVNPKAQIHADWLACRKEIKEIERAFYHSDHAEQPLDRTAARQRLNEVIEREAELYFQLTYQGV